MTIKQFVHDTRQQLSTDLATQPKLTHLYELIAAAFGYGSYAALLADAILLHQSPWSCAPDVHSIEHRASALGHHAPETLALRLAQHMQRFGLVCIKVDDLHQPENGRWDDESNWDDGYDPDDEDDRTSNEARQNERRNGAADELVRLLEVNPDTPLARQALLQLDAFANRGRPDVHWWLAQLLGGDEWLDYDGRFATPSDAAAGYWYRRQQQGDELSGPELAFADEFATGLKMQRQWLYHARHAAQEGVVEALYALAEARMDDGIFSADPTKVTDPSAIAWLAEEHGHREAAHRWYTNAAERGDTDAMLTLIDEYDKTDLYRCWVWLLLAGQCGVDFTQSDYRAIHDDGSDYDDDVGGPLHVVGRGGIELEPLSPTLAKQAELDAKSRFQRLKTEEPSR